MLRVRFRFLLVAVLVAAAPASSLAQTVEVAPFGGYRFGSDLFEIYLGRSIDRVGAPSVGVNVDLLVTRDASVCFLYSRQRMDGPRSIVFPEPQTSVTAPLLVEHWHLGGAYQLDRGKVRPFLSGTVGLTRFGAVSGPETRFSAAGGAGVKLMPSPHVGIRLDGRVYAVFVDGHVGTVICGGGGGCVIDLDLFVLWQVEFTAGVVFAF